MGVNKHYTPATTTCTSILPMTPLLSMHWSLDGKCYIWNEGGHCVETVIYGMNEGESMCHYG